MEILCLLDCGFNNNNIEKERGHNVYVCYWRRCTEWRWLSVVEEYESEMYG